VLEYSTINKQDKPNKEHDPNNVDKDHKKERILKND